MSNFESSTEDQVITEPKQHLERPKKYKVLLHNDDYTTMEFVVHILETVFQKSPSEATQIMLAVHNHGIGICGVYSYQVAETKIARVDALSKKYGYPLRCTMEEC